MAEDEQTAPAEENAPEASQPAAIAVEPVAAPVIETAVPDPAPVPALEPPVGPANKLHEWGAALGIMMFLALVLWMFLGFLRNMSAN